MVSFSLAGKTALVTGANKGLGRAIARALRDLGAEIHGTSRTAEGLHAIESDNYAHAHLLDISDVRSLREFVSKLPSTIDILINNAGVNAPSIALETTEAQWDSVLDTNLKGTFFLSREFARSWIHNGIAGSIVNIGSQAGAVGIEERAAYCASKGGLNQLTKVLAIEWAEHGIRINTVAPTFVRTDLTASTLDAPGWGQELLQRIPLGRFGEADDIVGAVAFLAGPSAGLITGTSLLVDGGYTAR